MYTRTGNNLNLHYTEIDYNLSPWKELSEILDEILANAYIRLGPEKFEAVMKSIMEMIPRKK